MTVIFEVMVPLALLLRVQVWPIGCVFTLTVYVEPLAYEVANVCVLLVVNVRLSDLSSCITRVPLRPVTATLIVNVADEQVRRSR